MTETRKPSDGVYLSFEKALLILVVLFVWISVIWMEKILPHQSLPIFILGIIAFYTGIISLANIHQRRKQGKHPVAETLSFYKPKISIVIAAHNEAAVIAETLDSFVGPNGIDYDEFDLWVFDDRSTDGTDKILKQCAERLPGKFHFVIRDKDATPGKSAVLNDALEFVEGEVLAVFDADGRVDPDFLTRIVPYLAEDGVGAVQARKVINNPEASYWTRCQFREYLMDAHYQTGRDAIRGAVELRGNGQLVKRKALQSVGGWNEETVTDDLDLSTQLHIAGWDIRFAADVTVMEEGVVHFKALLRQRRRWAEGSIKRYLEHSVQLFISPHISYRATADMIAYFIKFLFPVWVTADLSVQLFNLFWGEWPSHWTGSLIIMPALAFFFTMGSFVSIRNYLKTPVLPALWAAIETAAFLMVVWVPVVLWIICKIIVAKDKGPLNWGKTEHLGTQVIVKESRLERIKRYLKGRGSLHGS